MRTLIAVLLMVAPVAAATHTDTELVAAVLIGEAGIDREPGLIAVMEVVNTRATRAGCSHAAVVKKPKQFSCLNGVSTAKLVAESRKHPLWLAAMHIAGNPVTTSYTRGATHFESVHFPTPRWAHGRAVVAVVGRHKFYRL